MLLFYSVYLVFVTLGGRLDVQISTSSTCEYETILCKIFNIKEGYLKQQVKPYSFNCLAALGYCVAIIKLKTSRRCGCIIYRFLGFPEVILKVRLFGKICLGGVSYWKSTILMVCVLKVLNWPYNFQLMFIHRIIFLYQKLKIRLYWF